jgi:RNA polymerase sigma-70 factor, ECF subfamily
MQHSGNEQLDVDIISRVIEGDVNAFEVLIARYRSLVFGILLKHVPPDRAEEVAQDTFVEAFRSLGSFSSRSPFKHWLSKIAVRCCYNFWREQYGNKEIPASSFSEDAGKWLDDVLAADSREAFEREAASNDAAEVLAYAMDKLSAEDRMVLTLVHLDGYSVKEAANLLGWSLVLVKVRAHRSRNKLRKIISELLEERRGGV